MKREALGFKDVFNGSPYEPEYLSVLAVGEDENGSKSDCIAEKYPYSGQYSEKWKIVDGQPFQFWCLYGRGGRAERQLFFRTCNNRQIYVLAKGTFRFKFDPEAFARIVKDASKFSAKYFLTNAEKPTPEQKALFLEILQPLLDVSKTKSKIVASFLRG